MRIAVYLMYAVAALALAFAAYFAVRSAALVIAGEHLAGEVVRIDADDQAGSHVTHRPVIRFIDANREPSEWTGRGERTASSYGPGDKVELLRERGAEPRIEIDEFSGLWASALVCVALAWVFGGVGVLMKLSDGDVGWRLAGAFCVYFGLPFLAGGIAAALGDLAALRHGSWASGTVTNGRGVEWTLFKSDASSRGQLPAVVRMTAADGREVELTDGQANATYMAQGARVDVLYPPGRPYAGRIYAPLDHWLASLILLGIGLPLSAIGIVLWRRASPR